MSKQILLSREQQEGVNPLTDKVEDVTGKRVEVPGVSSTEETSSEHPRVFGVNMDKEAGGSQPEAIAPATAEAIKKLPDGTVNPEILALNTQSTSNQLLHRFEEEDITAGDVGGNAQALVDYLNSLQDKAKH